MKKSNICLTTENLTLLADFLENGYHLRDCLEFLEAYDNTAAFSYLKKEMMNGTSFQDAVAALKTDRDWQEYFDFISRFTSLEKAIRGALKLVTVKKSFADILFKQLTYPLGLLMIMMAFSVFFGGIIIPQIQILLSTFDLNQTENFLLESIMVLPFLLSGFMMTAAFCFLKVVFEIKRRNFTQLFLLLKIPLISACLQYYYSLKFASYYSVLSSYVTGLQDSIYLMYEKMTNSDLMVIIDIFKTELEHGSSFEECIKSNPFFHASLIRIWLIVLKMGNVQDGLNNYVENTRIMLEKKIRKTGRILTAGIYLLTAVFIVVLYLAMMMPMLNIAGQF